MECDAIVPKEKKRKRIVWSSEEGFDALQEILSKKEGYVIWNSDSGAEMDKEEWKKRKYNSKSEVCIYHRVCKTSASPLLNNLQQNQGIACFCSGKMSLVDPQYYDKMLDPDICNRLGWYAPFHDGRGLKPPSRESFYLSIANAENKNTSMQKCFCSKCETSASSMLGHLQQNQGIACFCSGSMPLDDPQYYDKMLDPVICNLKGWYAAFHKRGLKPPSRESFYLSIAKSENKSFSMHECVCSNCGTSGSSRQSDLRNNQGIDCGCRNKTETLILKPWLEGLAEREGYGQVCHNTLKYKRESTGGSCPFDFSLPALSAIVELDGNIQGGHFDSESDTPQRDLEKERWAREEGYQVFRVLQEEVWADTNGWDNWLATKLKLWSERRGRGLPPSPAIHPEHPLYLGGVYASLRGIRRQTTVSFFELDPS